MREICFMKNNIAEIFQSYSKCRMMLYNTLLFIHLFTMSDKLMCC